MSRTNKESKGYGWEIWSKRPGSCFPPGRDSKDITNGKERMKASRELFDAELELLKNKDADILDQLNEEAVFAYEEYKKEQLLVQRKRELDEQD